ncbi:MAG TPA: sigma-70 family RNA polymerase sigma factor [Pyrinomonadaceae bacterium]|nr:sigma-70 family RNA polymerase sigma factor [Pyrinomonadaceae bacterium]
MAAEIAHTFLRSADEHPRPREAAAADPLTPLVARARAGDTTAFDELMRATERKVVATAWRLLGDREDVRDAAQEVYLRAFKYLARFREGEDLGAWLYRITVNVCRDAAERRRRAGHVAAASDEELERAAAGFENFAETGDAEQEALRAQQRELLRRGLDALPERERAAIVLRDMEGLSTEEVARILNTRPVTVRSQVSSARAKLKVYCERLQRRGGLR